MIVSLIRCVAFLFALTAEATRPRPILFVVITNTSQYNTSIVHGMSIRSTPGFNPSRLPPNHPVTPLKSFTVTVIDTDNEILTQGRIDKWMLKECVRVQKREEHCFVWPSECCSYTLPVVDPRRIKLQIALSLASPSSQDSIGTVPTRPSLAVPCTQRTVETCFGNACSYFGKSLGCRRKSFCGFQTRQACEQTGHCRYVQVNREKGQILSRCEVSRN